jgi:hypothetical protein
MNCATHNDIAAAAFCRTCGKPLCANCTRDVRGVIYCEPCLAARLEGTAPAAGFVPPATAYPALATPGAAPRPLSGSGPNPALAGILAGFFPFGVGAVYCSQYAKGLAHLLIFALLIFGTDHAGSWDWLFGIGIAFFYVYQIIDAVRTAHAIQAGQPAPDPFGLGQTFGAGEKFDTGKVPVGAVILIGLGVLFLLHTLDFLQFSGELFSGAFLILLGGWQFARHSGLLQSSRVVCPCAQCRSRNLMGPAVLVTIGVLLALDSRNFSGLHWERTWPAILLVIGIVKLVQSNASSAGHISPMPLPPPAAPPPPDLSSSNPASSNPASSNQGPASSSGEVNHV